MARIQVLPLNTVTVGDASTGRFAVIIDQISDADDAVREWLQADNGKQVAAFGEVLGAETVLILEHGHLTVRRNDVPASRRDPQVVNVPKLDLPGLQAIAEKHAGRLAEQFGDRVKDNIRDALGDVS